MTIIRDFHGVENAVYDGAEELEVPLRILCGILRDVHAAYAVPCYEFIQWYLNRKYVAFVAFFIFRIVMVPIFNSLQEGHVAFDAV